MKKKHIIIMIVATVVLCLGCMFVFLKTATTGVLYTDDICNYNTDKYGVPLTIFPADVPVNADVVAFSYYSYWGSEEDIYLELKFDNIEDMQKHLADVERVGLSICSSYNPPQNYQWYVEQENGYNPLYDEKICTLYSVSVAEDSYAGYKVEASSGEITYVCSLGVMSYSWEELTVIHSYVRGWFWESINNHIPRYFERFDVPLEVGHERTIYLEWE